MTVAAAVYAPRAQSRHHGAQIPARLVPSRRALQISLGFFWLVDAVLQFQPHMFTKTFVNESLASTAAGNPTVVARPITWATGVMTHHVVAYNAAFATIQALLALGILHRRTVKVALATSVVWSMAVWWFGEGLGGVLTGATSPLMGAPGAAVLYAFAALLLWPSSDERDRETISTSLRLRANVPRAGWLTLWGSLAWMAIQPANRSPSSLGAMVSGMGSGEPGWVKTIDADLGGLLAGHGTEVSIVFALLCVFVGLSVFVSRAAGIAGAIAIVLGLGVWLVEDFGTIFTGRATDPNTGPLLVLLALAFLPPRLRGRKSSPGVVAGSNPAR